MRQLLLSLPRSRKRLIGVLFDTIAIIVCLELAFYIRIGITDSIIHYFPTYIIAIVTTLPILVRMGLYRAVLRYMGTDSIVTILKACSYAAICLMLFGFMFGQNHLPRSIPFIYWLMLLPVMTISRYLMRSWLLGETLADIFPEFFPRKIGHSSHGVPVAIYGAGAAGVQLMSALDKGLEYQPVAFLDDKRDNAGRAIQGRKIYRPKHFNQMLQESGAQEILLAIPSATRSRRKQIVQTLEQFGLPIRSIPSMADLASGRMKMQEIQNVDIGDVLGREEVAPREGLLELCITGRAVLVTGAGGSIGSELCRQILQQRPSCLVLYDHSEFNLYAIEQDLRRMQETLSECRLTKIPAVLGSVNDPQRLVETMSRFSIGTVYHAAAYKHVPMVEHNIEEGLRNNTLGTLYAAQAAIITNVERFVLISTDKAVRPTNIMGASKRLAEMVLQGLADEKIVKLYHAERFGFKKEESFLVSTCFTMVRFGNVLGSSGSVIPLFREQIRTGGPVTVTHPEINRYFMTIPEAALLVIQAGAMATGGEVFVLDMGKPVKITSLAKRMINLSGLTVKDENNPDGDISITFTGLRPGEKLYEELLIGDNVHFTDHPKISMAVETKEKWLGFCDQLDRILIILNRRDFDELKVVLSKYIHGFSSTSSVVDWMSQDRVAETSSQRVVEAHE
ncbi:polysaccharide biosynthesis protein [Sansalvadorimonas sp. 2012CJ34-2]|uniref:Polysaccharide biosynthesis protein n=1 Tax=Parendozoicomonas callyspongiae TaxID=2942213 RepID=A0ABT0PKY7_9GAMM|nr:nucleoside-diphosphate sugar epimerase/dehydratase [Sansalvadorimonas sp. 2012CJ34-2]MCL6272050.1 polysaccharide biosynthesis protein [Sansalvadorimonas sp. 2012CJ34-2]